MEILNEKVVTIQYDVLAKEYFKLAMSSLNPYTRESFTPKEVLDKTVEQYKASFVSETIDKHMRGINNRLRDLLIPSLEKLVLIKDFNYNEDSLNFYLGISL